MFHVWVASHSMNTASFIMIKQTRNFVYLKKP